MVLRGFLIRQANKEIYKTKLIAQLAVAMGAGDSIPSIWNSYLALESFSEQEVESRKEEMMEDYGRWSKVKLKLKAGGKIDGEAFFRLEGLPEESLPTAPTENQK